MALVGPALPANANGYDCTVTLTLPATVVAGQPYTLHLSADAGCDAVKAAGYTDGGSGYLYSDATGEAAGGGGFGYNVTQGAVEIDYNYIAPTTPGTYREFVDGTITFAQPLSTMTVTAPDAHAKKAKKPKKR